VPGLRILFLYSTLTVGGSESQLALLVPGLRDRGFQPTVATLRFQGRYFEELIADGIPCRFVAMRSRADLAGAARGYRLWRERPDVVFTQSIDAHVIGAAIARRARVPLVNVEQGGIGIHRGLHRRWLTKLVAPSTDRVVAVSEAQRPELLGLGYRSDAITVIPNGTRVLTPTRSRGEMRAELGLSDEDVVVLEVATLRPEKRADVFVDAVTEARRRDPRVRGLLAGGGPQLEAMRQRAAAAGDAVRVLGERRDVVELMHCADAVCLSSDVEGLPMTLAEGMAASRPVIATAVGGVLEAVVPGRTGWLVPRGDHAAFAAAIVELAGDLARAAAMGAEGLGRYRERFTVEAMVAAYEALLLGVARSS
jgi:glycosyltransferase involved in cell wall biosynthesis